MTSLDFAPKLKKSQDTQSPRFTKGGRGWSASSSESLLLKDKDSTLGLTDNVVHSNQHKKKDIVRFISYLCMVVFFWSTLSVLFEFLDLVIFNFEWYS